MRQRATSQKYPYGSVTHEYSADEAGGDRSPLDVLVHCVLLLLGDGVRCHGVREHAEQVRAGRTHVLNCNAVESINSYESLNDRIYQPEAY